VFHEGAAFRHASKLVYFLQECWFYGESDFYFHGLLLLGVFRILGIQRRVYKPNATSHTCNTVRENDMKTLKISDDVHQKLTSLLGELMAETAKMQTYQDAIEAMLNQSVILPTELLQEVEEFIEKHKHKGYTRKEEFIRQAIRFFLKWESEEYECAEIPKEKYKKLNEAIKDMDMPYYNAAEFIEDQIDKALEQYKEYLEETEKTEEN